MNKLKTSFRIFKRIIATLLVSSFLYLLIAIVLSIIPVDANDPDQDAIIDIYLATNGVHTDIIMPARNKQINWLEVFRYKDNLRQNTNYIAVGWGNKNFYLNVPEWSDLTPRVALSATFGFGDSVLDTTLL